METIKQTFLNFFGCQKEPLPKEPMRLLIQSTVYPDERLEFNELFSNAQKELKELL